MVQTEHLAALLTSHPEGPAWADIDLDVVGAAVRHGVAPLLHQALTQSADRDSARPEASEALSRIAREAVLLEEIRRRQMCEVLDELVRHGLRPLVFKGSALAYTHYPAPWLRPRGDTDLLVAPEAAPRAQAVLERLDLGRTSRPDGSRVTFQARYVWVRGSIELAYDLHWRLVDPHAFARLLPYEELVQSSRPVGVGGASAPDDVRALIIACVHRAAHHYDTDRLILLYDIDLVGRSLNSAEWVLFARLARLNGVRAVCARGLGLAATVFGTPVPDEVMDELRADSSRDEATQMFSRPGLRKIDILRSDLHALPTWRARASLVAGHLWPSHDYMRSTYGPVRFGTLPLFYLHRAWVGAFRWFRASPE